MDLANRWTISTDLYIVASHMSFPEKVCNYFEWMRVTLPSQEVTSRMKYFYFFYSKLKLLMGESLIPPPPHFTCSFIKFLFICVGSDNGGVGNNEGEEEDLVSRSPTPTPPVNNQVSC